MTHLHALAAFLDLRAAGLPKVRLRQALLQALEHAALACAQHSITDGEVLGLVEDGDESQHRGEKR